MRSTELRSVEIEHWMACGSHVQIIYPVGAFALMFLPMLLFYFDQESRPSGGRSLRKTAP
jgi:hypothetical protein